MAYYDNCPFEVTPYDTSQLVKTPKLVNVNYTNQDFWSMKSRLIDYIKEQYGESFNDFIESDLAMMLVENWAFIADTLSFKIDQVANEVFIDTVTELDNTFRLSMLVGFKPTPPIASRSMWAGQLSSLLETDLVIQAPIQFDFSTDEGERQIELYPADANNSPIFNEPIVIAAGTALNTSIIGLEGKSISQQGSGTGEINQYIMLGEYPVIWGSIRVKVDGNEWEEVDYFTDSQPRREFRVEHDPEYRGYVMFGNNRAGMIPSVGSVIEIEYRIGGGTIGNIVTGAIEESRNYHIDGFAGIVPVTFRNYTRGEYGYNGDDIDTIRRKLPVYIRTQNRMVTGDDYENSADNFITPYHGQIGKSKAVLRQYGCAANVVDLYVLAKSGESGLETASNELKVLLQEEIDSKKMITDYVCIKDGVVIDTDVHVDVVVSTYYRKFEDEIKERIERRINAFFSLSNWDYGKSLRAVDIIRTLADIAHINSVEATFLTSATANSGELVTARYYEIIRPQDIEISMVYE